METKRKRALETASVSQEGEHQPTVVSSADGAKVLNSLDSQISRYENLSAKDLYDKLFFHDLYSNRKTVESESFSDNSTNTQSSARTNDNAVDDAKLAKTLDATIPGGRERYSLWEESAIADKAKADSTYMKSEILVLRPDGSIKAYQKESTKEELKD